MCNRHRKVKINTIECNPNHEGIAETLEKLQHHSTPIFNFLFHFCWLSGGNIVSHHHHISELGKLVPLQFKLKSRIYKRIHFTHLYSSNFQTALHQACHKRFNWWQAVVCCVGANMKLSMCEGGRESKVCQILNIGIMRLCNNVSHKRKQQSNSVA